MVVLKNKVKALLAGGAGAIVIATAENAIAAWCARVWLFW